MTNTAAPSTMMGSLLLRTVLDQFELQAKYWPTLEAIESLVEKWRLWQTGRGKALSDEQNQALWAWANHITLGASRRHFKESQVKAQPWWTIDNRHHQERLDLFLQFLLDPRYTWPAPPREHKSPGWLVQAYRRRFVDIETTRELKEYGVATTRPVEARDGTLEYVVLDEGIAVAAWRESARVDRIRVQQGLPTSSIRSVWEGDRLKRGKPVTEARWDFFVKQWVRYKTFRELRHNEYDTNTNANTYV